MDYFFFAKSKKPYFGGVFWALSPKQDFLPKTQLCQFVTLKGALSGLRQFLLTESPLKMMKNAFSLSLKSLFVLKIFKFLS